MRMGPWILVLSILSTLGPEQAIAAEMERYTSAHYALVTNVDADVAQETLALLEAAWPQLDAWFGTKPALPRGLRLDVRLYATRAQWVDFARKQLGYVPPKTWGGMCDGRVASLHVQDDAASTRTVLLHEAIHQFHRRANTAKLTGFARWLGEGIAEHLARHTWDGETLQLGASPLVGTTDIALRASLAIGVEGYDITRTIRGLSANTRPEVWALTRYVALQSEQPFQALINAYSGERAPFRKTPTAWRNPTLRKDLLQWLPSQVAPLASVWPGWGTTGADSIACDATKLTVAWLRPKAVDLSCVFDAPIGTAWRAGLLLHYADAEHFTMALLAGSGGWIVLQREGATWHALQEGMRSFALDKPLSLRAWRSGEHVAFSVNGTRVTSVVLPKGALGFVAENGRTSFRTLRWDGPECQPRCDPPQPATVGK